MSVTSRLENSTKSPTHIKGAEDFEQAIKLLDSKISNCQGCSENTLSELYNERGYTNYLSVEFDAAVADYTKAISADATKPVYYYNRALVHYRLGRFSQALDDANEALHLNPDFSDAKLCKDRIIIDGKLEL